MTIALDAALSGLRVAQQALDVASRNVSNASTPGYTRKILPQESLVVTGIGLGVKSGALTRHIDNALILDLRRQNAVSGNYNVRAAYFSRIQDYIGAPDSGRAISSKLSVLTESFSKLSTAPNDQILLSQTVLRAQQTAGAINGFSELITSLRSDAETDITSAIIEINSILDNISRLNGQIGKADNAGQDSVDLEDLRDNALEKLSEYIDFTTFKEGPSTYVITRQGETLVDNGAHHLFFQKSNILPTSYYPGGGLNGLTVNSASGTDITQTYLGGKMAALFALRDETLPQYAAQLDEFAQKLAERCNNEGLKLFTDPNGNVPASVASPGLVGYTGFAAIIQVNAAVVNDPTLIRNGTTGNTESSGSNEVIRRISQFALGTYQYQKAAGTVDISAGALVAGLSLTTQTRVTGNVNLAAYINMGTVPGLTTPCAFDVTIGATTKTINIAAADTAADIVSEINTQFGSTQSFIDGNGQLVIYGAGNITIADNTIGAPGIAAIGLAFGVTAQPNPSFQVQVGTRPPVTISIAPADTSVQLLAALNAVPGLTASLGGGGELILIPTDGGDLKVLDILGAPLAAMGVAVTNVAHTAFRQDFLGADGTLSTGLLGTSTLQNFVNSVITIHAQDNNLAKNGSEQEEAFLQSLKARNMNISGVNIDQEMSDLIRIQSNYAAAAKMISVTQKMMDELFSTIAR